MSTSICLFDPYRWLCLHWGVPGGLTSAVGREWCCQQEGWYSFYIFFRFAIIVPFINLVLIMIWTKELNLVQCYYYWLGIRCALFGVLFWIFIRDLVTLLVCIKYQQVMPMRFCFCIQSVLYLILKFLMTIVNLFIFQHASGVPFELSRSLLFYSWAGSQMFNYGVLFF